MYIDGKLYYRQKSGYIMLWRSVLYENLEINMWYDYMDQDHYGQCCLRNFKGPKWVQNPQNYSSDTIFLEFLGTYQRTANDVGILEAEFKRANG